MVLTGPDWETNQLILRSLPANKAITGSSVVPLLQKLPLAGRDIFGVTRSRECHITRGD
jgi:hypothetical protein